MTYLSPRFRVGPSKSAGKGVGEAANPPVLDHDDPSMDGFVGGVEDYGVREREVLGGQSSGEGEQGHDRPCERFHNLASFIPYRSCSDVIDGGGG